MVLARARELPRADLLRPWKLSTPKGTLEGELEEGRGGVRGETPGPLRGGGLNREGRVTVVVKCVLKPSAPDFSEPPGLRWLGWVVEERREGRVTVVVKCGLMFSTPDFSEPPELCWRGCEKHVGVCVVFCFLLVWLLVCGRSEREVFLWREGV